MSIQESLQTLTYALREEIASRVMLFTRTVEDSPLCPAKYGATIHPFSITYELDAEGNKLGIYETKVLKEFDVTEAQLMGLFGIQVTLADGTVSYVGEVISNFADQLIAANLQSKGTITTQHIDISSIIPPPVVPIIVPPVQD